MTNFLEQAGGWFLHSGIQEPSGGVARYYRSDVCQNAGVSNEITGYTVSALAYLHSLAPGHGYREAAVDAARYLTDHAWNAASSMYAFEPGSEYTYFFDTGIIVRGLLAAWRATGDERFRVRACGAALSLADFLGDGFFHPILSLPDKQPLAPRGAGSDERWSRCPGCYQLKSALAWRDLGDEHASRWFESVLEYSLATHKSFLPGDADREKVMDRLHAYGYFLEGLLAAADREAVRRAIAAGLERVDALFSEIAPDFERSDVSAQLLRVRLIAHHFDILPLDERAACQEADRVASYQVRSPDAKLDGGFWFGRRRGTVLPFVNPVSTAFGLQALALWQQHRTGTWRFQLHELI